MKKSILPGLVLMFAASGAQASCWFVSGSAPNGTIPLPATLRIPSDSPNGTVLWSSGWRPFGNFDINCLGTGVVAGTLASGIGAAVPGYVNASGYNSVFATNVPGIGISVYWCNQTSCNPDYNHVTPIASLPQSWGTISAPTYNLPSSWWVQLVKTGPVSPGAVSVGGGLSSIRYYETTVANLAITGATSISAIGCQLNPTNITVPLPTVTKDDFTDASPTPTSTSKATPFNISLLCDADVQVRYEIDGTQTATNVLANSTGGGMAQGIGVQLLQGDPGSADPVPLGQYVAFQGRTASSGPVSIPLVATYYKTVPIASVVPGNVMVTATFTVLYQ